MKESPCQKRDPEKMEQPGLRGYGDFAAEQQKECEGHVLRAVAVCSNGPLKAFVCSCPETGLGRASQSDHSDAKEDIKDSQ